MPKSMLDGVHHRPPRVHARQRGGQHAHHEPRQPVENGRVPEIKSTIREFFTHFDNLLGGLTCLGREPVA